MFIFPGIGLGALVSGAKTITDQMFYNSALALAECVTDEQLQNGEVGVHAHIHCCSFAICALSRQVFPRLQNIRNVSLHVAAAVATTAHYESVATVHKLNWFAVVNQPVLALSTHGAEFTRRLQAMKDHAWDPIYTPLSYPMN